MRYRQYHRSCIEPQNPGRDPFMEAGIGGMENPAASLGQAPSPSPKPANKRIPGKLVWGRRPLPTAAGTGFQQRWASWEKGALLMSTLGNFKKLHGPSLKPLSRLNKGLEIRFGPEVGGMRVGCLQTVSEKSKKRPGYLGNWKCRASTRCVCGGSPVE